MSFAKLIILLVAMEPNSMFLVLLMLQVALSHKMVEAQGPPAPPCQLCTPLTVTGVPAALSNCFSGIYVFGDSLEDVGNFAATFPGLLPSPYGVTNPGCSKGRYSDGGLVVDFLASASGLPTTLPSQACECGTNFAFAGATALSLEYYQERHIRTLVPVSLQNETQWFSLHKSRCQTDLKTNLFIIGGGGNDYGIAAMAGFSPSNITATLVDAVVNKLVQMTLDLVNVGAKNVLVFNLPQLSCSPRYKGTLQDQEGVDELGCLKGYARIFRAHNMKLRKEILDLRLRKGVTVALADRYAFLNEVLEHPWKYGFQRTDAACCGGGGRYNSMVSCWLPSSTACTDPYDYVFFDEIHFTESFSRRQAAALVSRESKYLISRSKCLAWSVFCNQNH